jgi:hypothetical protein
MTHITPGELQDMRVRAVNLVIARETSQIHKHGTARVIEAAEVLVQYWLHGAPGEVVSEGPKHPVAYCRQDRAA